MRSRAWRSARAAAVLPAVLATAVAAGCGIGTGDVVAVPDEELPRGLRPTSTVTAPAPDDVTDPAPATVTLYWVREGRLVGEAVTFDATPTPERLLGLLSSGPQAAPDGRALRTAVPDDAGLRVTGGEGATVRVALPRSFSASGPDQTLAIGQVVMTLTSLRGVDGVDLRLGDQRAEIPVADGSLVRRTLSAGDYAALLSPPGESR